MKRILALVCCLCMLFALSGVSEAVTLVVTPGGYDYRIENGEVTITDYHGGETGNLVIPQTIEGLPVVALGEESFSEKHFTSVTVPGSVKTIGYEAFYDCEELVSVVLSSGVTTLEQYVFHGCEKLVSVTIPTSVVSVENNILDNTAIYNDPANWVGDLFYYGDLLLQRKDVDTTGGKNYTVKNGTRLIASYVFDGPDVVSVTLPDSLQVIGAGAFAGSQISTISLPQGLTIIDDYAFNDCNNLTAITVGENNQAYQSKDGVLFSKDGKTLVQYPTGKKDTTYTIPAGVTTIGESAFEECENLTAVTIPNGVTTIGEWAFYACKNLATVTIGDSVTTIGESAFEKCENLTAVTIPNGVTTIGKSAFYACENLATVTIADSVTTIGKWAFCSCHNLTALTLGKGVITIEESAFFDCKALGELSLPEGLTTIENNAFGFCYTLVGVTVPGSVTTIGEKAFGYVWENDHEVMVTLHKPEGHLQVLKTIKEGFTIKGVKGSAAERYATKHGIAFEEVVIAPAEQETGRNWKMIALIAGGGLAMIALLVVLVVLYKKKKANPLPAGEEGENSAQEDSQPQEPQQPDGVAQQESMEPEQPQPQEPPASQPLVQEQVAETQAIEAVQEPAKNVPLGVADELLKFKTLLDMGAITQEEYEAKKNQLLKL